MTGPEAKWVNRGGGGGGGEFLSSDSLSLEPFYLLHLCKFDLIVLPACDDTLHKLGSLQAR